MKQQLRYIPVEWRGTLFAARIHHWTRIAAQLLFWLLASSVLVVLAMENGIWRQQYTIAGPFAPDSNLPQHCLILTFPKEGPPAWWQQPLIGDTSEKQRESFLELYVNDQKMGPPHTAHDIIRNGKTLGFSHWRTAVLFPLPPGVQNGPETTATLQYSIKPRRWIKIALIVPCVLIGFLLGYRRLGSWVRRRWTLALPGIHRLGQPIAVLLRAPYLILPGLCYLGLAGSVLFVLSSLAALAMGWALPTTALLRWSAAAEWVARNEIYLGHLLLTVSGLGTLATWYARIDADLQRFVDIHELRLRRLLAWCGFPIVACAFVLCASAMWSGIVRPGDLHTSNIGGLVPFNDAHGHLASAFDQARDGTWIPFAQRRPLAAAFRAVLLFFSDYSFTIMLLLQAFLLAAATCLATYSVVAWRGVWAGLTFFSLVYIYARIFAPTSLSEPLGLFWALLAIPFLIEAFRTRSEKSALLGFAILTFALMTRMGSMFTMPAMLVWLVWQFGTGARAKLRIGVLAISILIGMYGLNSLLLKAYGTNSGELGGNFSYVACGLSMGTGWKGCPDKLAAQGEALPPEEAQAEKVLYRLAWQNIQSQPGVFFVRLADGAAAFASLFPDVMWRGYGVAVSEPDWLLRNLLTAISLIGIAYIAIRRAGSLELSFWALMWSSIIVSSSIVYFDDGSRTLAVSQPLIALFFALGFSNPSLGAVKMPNSGHGFRYGVAGLTLATALFVCVPWVANRFSPISTRLENTPKFRPDEAFVFGGRRMSGFLVVADDQPLRGDIPTLHLRDFKTIVGLSYVETYQGLVNPISPPTPFGFVYAPRLERLILSGRHYIVPMEVMERHDVQAWHFNLAPWQHKAGTRGDYWSYVSRAEPWPR